ncbi:cyclin-K [Ditylenchus destructor]|uniref:Cyclin-K n=1 Tax=Ditylenchus destructor TaxID=166010 RepID=A0AAD4MP36_9BILA|nr:cyclin-K [Ditylenchus destructor]
MSVGNHWLFTQKQLEDNPSRKFNIGETEEEDLRREGVKIILDVGKELKLMQNPTLSTASVFFHRFYMFHSFTEFPKHLTALGCLFLAGKVEETPKKCKDICTAAVKVFPLEFTSKTLIEDVMSLERVLLQTVRFDLHVEHPYPFLLQYAKALKENVSEEADKELIAQAVQHAWAFVNDSASTTLCLQWEPEVVAISMLYMAIKLAKMEVQSETLDDQWWEMRVPLQRLVNQLHCKQLMPAPNLIRSLISGRLI